MDIFSYIPVIYSVRIQKFTPFKARNPISNTRENVHKTLASYMFDNNVPCAMIYDNELTVLRNIGDVNNNEIKSFITTNNIWDVLILSKCSEPSALVENFNLIEKLDNETNFKFNYVYLISNRFMQKIKNNDLTNIKIYKYNQPFLEYANMTDSTNVFTIGKVEQIKNISSEKLSYTWKEW